MRERLNQFFSEFEMGQTILGFSHAMILRTIMWDFKLRIKNMKNLMAMAIEVDKNGGRSLIGIFQGIN